MPKWLEDKLDKEYPGEPDAKFAIMNKMGVMHGNKITAKGEAMEEPHVRAAKAVAKFKKKR